jgi:hypothetical protein
MKTATRVKSNNSQNMKWGGVCLNFNMLNKGLSYALAAMLTVGLFFGFGWSAPEEAHAAAGDTVEASSIAVGGIIYYGNYPQTKVETPVGAPSSPANGAIYTDTNSTKYEYVDSSTNANDGWYKYEPIAWRVLENASENLLLLAEKAIDVKPYNETRVSMTWEKSTARSWLNGYNASENTNGKDFSDAGNNFIGTAFTSAEQAKIVSTTITNPDTSGTYQDSGYTTPGGNPTTDKIFYLKLDDAKDTLPFSATYFVNDNARKAAATSYAIALGAYVYGGVSWWLRSPGRADNLAANVAFDGSLLTNGSYVDYTTLAVRPAFYLKNSDLDLIETSAGDYLAVMPSENAYLKSLSPGTGTLTPSYSPEITDYSVSVPYSTSSITLAATKADENAMVVGAGTKTLACGDNTYNILVIAEDRSTEKAYAVKVTRANPPLSNLTVSAGTLSPEFSPETYEYSVNVPYSTSSITLTATKADTQATVTGAGAKSLNPGANEYVIMVMTKDGSTQTYTVTVTHAAASADANLSNLAVNAGTLSPEFSSGTTNYTVSVPYSTSSITLTATTANANATVTGNGAKSLNVGANNIFSIRVTAEDGETQKTYTVTVTRATASANANLKSLSVSGAALAPAFNAGAINYSASVPNAIARVTITAAVADSTATVTGIGAKALNVGANVFKIAVTAQNKTVKTYTVTVTRAQPIPNVTSIKAPMTSFSIVAKTGKLNLKNLVGIYTTGNKPIKDSKLTWTSGNTKVATVETGAVKAGKQTGTTVITVKAQNGKSLRITITVVKKTAKLKKLTGNVPAIKVGKPAFITLKGTGTNITGVKWSVKGKGMKIDKFGMATATKTGKYTITATVGGKKWTKKVTVK